MRDEDFLRNKVPMTKSEARAVSIDKLQLLNKKTFLDIGAGTGSISIQAAHDFPDLQVTAIERDASGLEIIKQNMAKFCIKNIDLIAGNAPEAIPDKIYDAIFVGGSGSNLESILRFASEHLNSAGSLVLNFILLENALKAQKILAELQFTKSEIIEVAVSQWHQLGKGHYFKPNNPTIIMNAIKGE